LLAAVTTFYASSSSSRFISNGVAKKRSSYPFRVSNGEATLQLGSATKTTPPVIDIEQRGLIAQAVP
jgi:hypothetical protein